MIPLTIWIARTEKLIIDNSPSILTAIGIVGSVTTALLAGQGAYKAGILIYETEIVPGELDAKEKVRMCWPLFIPAVGTGAITIAAILGANHIGTRRAAGMAAAYSISERAFSEYRDKVVEKMGAKSERSIRDDIAQDHVRRTEEASREVIVVSGDVLCCDAISGRYLTSNIAALQRAENELNRSLINDSYASLTDFYNLIGLRATVYSDEVGWNSNCQLELKFSAVLTEDDKPCMSFTFNIVPVRDYRNFF